MNAVPQQVTDFIQQSGPFDMLDIEQIHDIARHSIRLFAHLVICGKARLYMA